MDWASKRVLVTGAGGFIGSHLTEELVRQGATVRAFIRYNARGNWGNLEYLPRELKREVDVVAGDIRDPFFVHGAVDDVDIIFHLAALIGVPYSYFAPQSYVETNVSGTLNVVEAARRHGTSRVVHTSTSETYGSALYTPIDEDHPLQAQSPYSATKIGADKVAESYGRSFDVPIVTVRPFNTFGPRQSARAVIPTIVSQALYSDRIELGSLEPVRDLTYVDDTVHGFLRAAETPEAVGQVINLGTGRGVSIGHVADTVCSTLGIDGAVVSSARRVRPERSEVSMLICDNRKAMKCLQWTPQIPLEDGLLRVVEWVRSHPEAYRSDTYAV